MKRIREMNRKQKRQLIRIVLASITYIAALAVPSEGVPRLLIFLVPYGVAGWKVLQKAAKNIVRGQVFDENFLMCVASVGAMCAGEYSEAVAVMLFYQIGELFESCAVDASRRSIAAMMDIRPDIARVVRDGRIETVDPAEVGIGEIIEIRPGDRVPLDGTVIDGESALDTAALTGEPVPRTIRIGDRVISGCVNLNGAMHVRVESVYGESTVAKILELVENASARKAKSESFITHFAGWYTPAVCGCALILAVVPPIFGGAWREWISRALIFLVVSCPCALVISVPLTFFGGIGGASKRGILVKGGNFMESLAMVQTVVFDKTGTLTKGSFEVTAVHPEGISGEKLLEIAALAESRSTHPIAESLRRAYGKEPDSARVTSVREISGQGVVTVIDGREIAAGSAKLMRTVNAEFREDGSAGTIVHFAADGRYLGHVVISDELKPNAKAAIKALKAGGVKKCVMLTGDREEAAEAVKRELGLDASESGLLPAEKVERVEAMLREQGKGECLAFAGDGINDAPVMMRADVGVAMGALGSDATIEAADVVLMDDDPMKISTAISIARRTLRIVRENIAFALGVKLIVLALSALGLTNMWAAVFADVGVSVLAILNAMRALKFEDKKSGIR